MTRIAADTVKDTSTAIMLITISNSTRVNPGREAATGEINAVLFVTALPP
jgi:hypothetical protein